MTPTSSASRPSEPRVSDPGVRETLVKATGAVMSRLGETIRVTLVVQGLVALLGIPFLAWLFPVLLDLLGERAITAIDLGELLRHPVAVSVFTALLLGIAALLLAEVLVFLVVAGRRFRPDPASPRLGVELVGLVRRLGHPSTLLLVPYAALLLPFGGLAVGGLFTGGIRIPFPLTSELLSTVGGTVVYLVLLLATIYVEARLILTLPLLAGGVRHVGAAMRESWHATRGRTPRIVALVAVVAVVTVVVASGLTSVGLGPTRYADGAFPDAAPAVAVVSLTLVEIALFLLVGFGLAVLAQAAMWTVRPITAPLDPPGDPVRLPARSRRLRRAAVAVVGVVAAASITVSNGAALASLSDGTSTVLVAHRGVFASAVENTVAAVEAAAVGNPDFVEIDVQQTRDGNFVVFHDATLRRLADDPRRVSEMTTSQLVNTTIRQDGREDRIPTLSTVLARASKLEQPLFLELKIHGRESEDYLERLVALIDRYDARDHVRLASFDRAVVERIAAEYPTIPAGLLVTLNLGKAPTTSADFLIVNANSYTPALRDDAWARGLELYVWTVNDMRAVRDLLRDSVDGIITDRTFAAKAVQQNIRYENGIATRLEDAFRRAIGW